MGRRRQQTIGPAYRMLNNNVVIAVDDSGRERVLMGRGIGYRLDEDAGIDPERVEKTFILDNGKDADRTRQMLEEVPYEIIEAVTRAVDVAERELGHRLGRGVTIGIIDHVRFALERLDDDVRIPSSSLPQLRVLHPREFAAAQHLVTRIGDALDRELPSEEAVFLTMHLLNATWGESGGSAAQMFRSVQHVIEIVERDLDVPLDPDDPACARFILHVQFLLQRLGENSMLASGATSFYEFAKHSYPEAHAVAEEVEEHLARESGIHLTEEELLYVTVHVQRLRGILVPPKG